MGFTRPLRPHIFLLLIDDLGWGNVGFNRAAPTREVHTPTLDGLVASGVKLDRFYVFSCCSPSRASVLSGRLPPHVETWLTDPSISNANDTESGWAGIPRSMTGLAAVLRRANYSTAAVGKWDAGMATPQHTPRGRGFESSLVYFHHQNDYFTRQEGGCAMPPASSQSQARQAASRRLGAETARVPAVDLWGSPRGLPDAPAASVHLRAGELYEELLFKQEALRVIRSHPSPAYPLFLYYASHIAHQPYEVPAEYLARFSFIGHPERRVYHAMVACLDDVISELVSAFRARGLWEDTLMVASSDNGGPIAAAANNFPLRGGKYSDWEGGIRAVAFVTGGAVPAAARGSTVSDPMHLADLYATFAALARIDPFDGAAARAGLPPVDGVDLWPRLSGQTMEPPREELYGGPGHLVQGPYKLLVGEVPFAAWTGPVSPNATGPSGRSLTRWSCPACRPPVVDGRVDCAAGCLYNVEADPSETRELSLELPERKQQMLRRHDKLRATDFNPDRGGVDPRACTAATSRYASPAGAFWGPFAFLDS